MSIFNYLFIEINNFLEILGPDLLPLITPGYLPASLIILLLVNNILIKTIKLTYEVIWQRPSPAWPSSPLS